MAEAYLSHGRSLLDLSTARILLELGAGLPPSLHFQQPRLPALSVSPSSTRVTGVGRVVQELPEEGGVPGPSGWLTPVLLGRGRQ